MGKIVRGIQFFRVRESNEKLVKEVVIFGYSGHSFVCIEIAELNNYIVRGYYDLHEKIFNPFKLHFLGYVNDIKLQKVIFICIGDNRTRADVFNSLKEKGCEFINLIHPRAIISKNVHFDTGILISAGAIINSCVDIGTCCIINTGAIIGFGSRIGDFVHLAPGVVILEYVEVGSGTFIGANSIIAKGVKIISNCIIGAGAVVDCHINEPGTYVGNPARLLK